jgi:hypothetical protein
MDCLTRAKAFGTGDLDIRCTRCRRSRQRGGGLR